MPTRLNGCAAGRDSGSSGLPPRCARSTPFAIGEAAIRDQSPSTTEPDDLFEPDRDRPERANRLRFVLVAGLVAALAFAGGVVVVQK